MIETLIEAMRIELLGLLPLAAVFVTLACITKRRRVLAGLRPALPEITTNLVLLLINAALVASLLAVPVLGDKTWVPRPEALVTFWAAMPELLCLIVAVLLADFAAYWRHRLEHSRGLWPIHATHHADEAMNWLSVRRKHPLGEVLGLLLDGLPVFLIGLPFWAIAGAFLLRGWWGYFIHADVPWTLGPLGKLLISPAAHRLHHIRDEQLMGHNFGNTVTLWDRLFGTYRDPADHLNCETGIAEGTRDAAGELLRPFERRYWQRPEARSAPLNP